MKQNGLIFFLHADGAVLHSSSRRNSGLIDNARLHTQVLCAFKTVAFFLFEYYYYKNNSFVKNARLYGDLVALFFVGKTFFLLT
ncbi:MAG TPA: hypothetical protein VL201_03240 [Patescibacteria group bacterium]|nr:hypothetical protein [Patescibacteria group bacterium]